MISEIMVAASAMELARKNIQANEMKQNVEMILKNSGTMAFFFVNLE
jgi:hypothetical protein